MINNFAACRIVFGNDEIKCTQNFGKGWAGERHGLHRAEVKRAIGPDKEQTRFGKQGRFFEPGRGHAVA